MKKLRDILEVKMNFGWDIPDKSSIHTRKSGKLRTLKGYERAVAASKRRERPEEKDNAERGGTEYGSLFRREDIAINNASGGEVEGLGENPPVSKRRNPRMFDIIRRRGGKKNVGRGR